MLPNREYLVISPGCRLQEIEIGRLFYKGQEVEQFTIAQDEVEVECDTPISTYSLIHIVR